MLKLVSLYMGRGSLHRGEIFTPDMALRVLRWLNMDDDQDCVWAARLMRQSQLGLRAATSTLLTWGDVDFCDEGAVLGLPRTKTNRAGADMTMGLHCPSSCGCCKMAAPPEVRGKLCLKLCFSGISIATSILSSLAVFVADHS